MMSDSRLVQRYARACFNVAREDGILEKVYADFKTLLTLTKKFESVFVDENSLVSTSQGRLLFVRKLFAAYKFNKITKNLLSLLAEYGHLASLHNIIENWFNLYSESKKETNVEVVSAKAVDSESLDYIQSFFERKIGRKISIKNVLDETILGGLIIKFGSFMLDGSVASKLRKVKRILGAPVRHSFSEDG